jgi:hypothetical protein
MRARCLLGGLGHDSKVRAALHLGFVDRPLCSSPGEGGRQDAVLRAARNFIVLNATPEQVGLPGVGWRVGMATTGSTVALALHARYFARASTIDSSK